jgi:hypothetical protein
MGVHVRYNLLARHDLTRPNLLQHLHPHRFFQHLMIVIRPCLKCLAPLNFPKTLQLLAST